MWSWYKVDYGKNFLVFAIMTIIATIGSELIWGDAYNHDHNNYGLYWFVAGILVADVDVLIKKGGK